MDRRFKGKISIVTGTPGGIGKTSTGSIDDEEGLPLSSIRDEINILK